MKIIILVPFNPFFENSASANRILTLIQGLSNLGIALKIIITGGYRTKTEYKELGKKGKIGHIKYEYITSLFSYSKWQKRINKYLFIPLTRLIVQAKVLRIASNNPNAIFWTGSDMNAFRIVIKLKEKLPQVKTFLELSEFLEIHRINKGRSVHMFIGDKRQSLFERKAFFAYTGLALMTKSLLNHYKNFPDQGPKLLHLPMTVDLKRFTGQLQPLKEFQKPYIAFVGVMNNVKEGVDILIQAFSIISNQFHSHKLYLVGPWHYDTPGHKKLISKLGLDEKVFWMEEYKRDEIPCILKYADLLALSRPDSRQAQGGFPTKLGEYLASGNPVCATKVGEIPDYLTDGESVYFAEPGSVESFANAMRRALSNPEEARRVGANGRKVAETHFNKDIQAKILFDFLQQNLQPKA